MADDNFLAPAAFKPAEALVQLKRQLREAKPLTERTGGFAYEGNAVLELKATADAIDGRVAKRPARSPEWRPLHLTSAMEVRHFLEGFRDALKRWERGDD